MQELVLPSLPKKDNASVTPWHRKDFDRYWSKFRLHRIALRDDPQELLTRGAMLPAFHPIDLHVYRTGRGSAMYWRHRGQLELLHGSISRRRRNLFSFPQCELKPNRLGPDPVLPRCEPQLQLSLCRRPRFPEPPNRIPLNQSAPLRSLDRVALHFRAPPEFSWQARQHSENLLCRLFHRKRVPAKDDSCYCWDLKTPLFHNQRCCDPTPPWRNKHGIKGCEPQRLEESG